MFSSLFLMFIGLSLISFYFITNYFCKKRKQKEKENKQIERNTFLPVKITGKKESVLTFLDELKRGINVDIKEIKLNLSRQKRKELSLLRTSKNKLYTKEILVCKADVNNFEAQVRTFNYFLNDPREKITAIFK